jgi:hypothetical protein
MKTCDIIYAKIVERERERKKYGKLEQLNSKCNPKIAKSKYFLYTYYSNHVSVDDRGFEIQSAVTNSDFGVVFLRNKFFSMKKIHERGLGK